MPVTYADIARSELMALTKPKKRKMKVLKFTPIEWEIIEHRLEAPDAIADTLADDSEGAIDQNDQPFRDKVYMACRKLIESEGCLDWSLSKLEEDVLFEACNGSVFMSIAESLVTDDYRQIEYGGGIYVQKYTAYDMACDRIESKLQFVNIPRS